MRIASRADESLNERRVIPRATADILAWSRVKAAGPAVRFDMSTLTAAITTEKSSLSDEKAEMTTNKAEVTSEQAEITTNKAEISVEAAEGVLRLAQDDCKGGRSPAVLLV